MTGIDISTLSAKELVALRTDIDSQLAARIEADLDKLRGDIVELCAARGFTLQQVLATLRGKKPQKQAGASTSPHFVKGRLYRNPADPSQTWEGFGGRPLWLKNFLAKGGQVADLTPPEPAPKEKAPEAPAATPAKAPAKAPVKPAAKPKK